MRTAKIVSISSSDQVGLYSICFNNGESEFRKFLKKFKDNAALNRIISPSLTLLTESLQRVRSRGCSVTKAR